MQLKDKVALVTGSGRGIGKEIALALAKAGAHIVLVDVDETTLAETAIEITSVGVQVLTVKADISSFTETEKLLGEVMVKFGKVDILVNNAGITRDNLLLRMREKDWDMVLAINLKGTFNCTRAAARHMLKQRSGKIVNIASIIGLSGNAGQANYAASKAGVIAFTKSTAKEFASRNINVNAVAPGFIQTAMTDALKEEVRKAMQERIPLGRFGTPRDVANAVLFLISDAADYITGQTIVVDGGMVM